MRHLTYMRLLCKWLVLCALMMSLGLHWVVLQSAAWTGMVLQYAQQDGLGAALEKTFDGNHPCALCKKLAANTESEQKKSSPQPSKPKPKLELELLAVEAPVHLFSSPSVPLHHTRTTAEASRSDEPPKPPPRGEA